MDPKNFSNFFDILNMFIGVYFDQYSQSNYSDYYKASDRGVMRRTQDFDIKDQEYARNIWHKLYALGYQEKSKYFYYKKACEYFAMIDGQGKVFIHWLMIREALLKNTFRYQNLTEQQADLDGRPKEPGYSPQEFLGLKNAGWMEEIFVPELIDKNVEIEFQQYSDFMCTLDNRYIDKKIQKIDEELRAFAHRFYDSLGEQLEAIKAEKAANVQIAEPEVSDDGEVIEYNDTFTFTNINQWSHELNRAVFSFKERYSIFPEGMLANSTTFNRIDIVANTRPEKLRNGEMTKPEQFVALSGFQGDGYSLDWYTEEALAESQYKLFAFTTDGGDRATIKKAV